jgi:dsRNA-specific ribonuclease
MAKSKKPVFNVIYNQFGRGIKFENIFEFGQVEGMLAELKKLKKKLTAAYAKKELNGDDEAFKKIVNRLFWDEKKRIKKYTPDELIEIELRRKCQYYFWAKCEYEVIVTGWPDTKTERKIDIYDQLDANWETFKNMAFEVIG